MLRLLFFASCCLLPLLRAYAEQTSPDSAVRDDAWVRQALRDGATLIDKSATTAPLERVRQQWIDNATSQIKRLDGLRAQIDAAERQKKMSPQLIGDMLLFAAYAEFGNPEVQDVLMKTFEEGLACHLLFNTDKGLVDVVYGYDASGDLKIFRIDRLPENVFVSMPARKDASNFVFLWFKDQKVSIVLDTTDPFAGFVQVD
jgi:hypothetical protein